jgi:lipid-A-disaccharide synthase
MLAAARNLHRLDPNIRFEAAAASETLAGEMRRLADGFAECDIHVGGSHGLMQRAGAGMVCSGTATLESAYFGLPMTILYKVAWLTWVVGKRLVVSGFSDAKHPGRPRNREGVPSRRRQT